MTTDGRTWSSARRTSSARVTSTSSWPRGTTSKPRATAARTKSLPNCPLAPRTTIGLEDDIALQDILQRAVPVDQGLVPLYCLRGWPVVQSAAPKRVEDLSRPVLGCVAGCVPKPVMDLAEADPIGAVVRIAVPVLCVWQFQSGAKA